MTPTEDPLFLHVVISLGILLSTAKVFAEIFHPLKTTSCIR